MKRQVRRIRAKLAQIFPPPKGPKRVHAHSDVMHNIVAADAKIDRIATGFKFTEGPIWRPELNALWFSDIPRNSIHEWCDGRVRTVRKPSRHANGNTLDHQGRLLTCEHSGRCVSRTEADGTVAILADMWDGKRLNSPNDLVVARDGSIYFTDPPFGIKPDQQELAFSGVFRINASGHLSLLDTSMPAPNGLAFSADESKLFVDDSKRKELRVFDVNKDGTLSRGRSVHDMDNGRPGNPDGMKFDSDGNLFVTGPGGIWVFSADMAHVGTIELPEIPANCAWGEDGQSLFVTARRSLYRVRCLTSGPVLGG